MKNNEHPCLSCVLPDCDETSRRCGLNVAFREYDKYRGRRGQMPAAIREAYNIAWRERYSHHRNERRRSIAQAERQS